MSRAAAPPPAPGGGPAAPPSAPLPPAFLPARRPRPQRGEGAGRSRGGGGGGRLRPAGAGGGRARGRPGDPSALPCRAPAPPPPPPPRGEPGAAPPPPGLPAAPRLGAPRASEQPAAAEASSVRHLNANRSHKQLSVRLPLIMCLHTSSAAPRAAGLGPSRAPGGAAAPRRCRERARVGPTRPCEGSEPRLCLQGRGCVWEPGHGEPGLRTALSLSARSSSRPFPGPAPRRRAQPLAV